MVREKRGCWEALADLFLWGIRETFDDISEDTKLAPWAPILQ